ncbi:MAG: hypothetical protein QM656_08105 [Paracoccaceae bacterium]
MFAKSADASRYATVARARQRVQSGAWIAAAFPAALAFWVWLAVTLLS